MTIRTCLVFGVCALISSFTGCGSDGDTGTQGGEPTEHHAGTTFTINLNSGRNLSGPNGMMLYYHLNDAPGNDTSNCLEDCLAQSKLKPFFVEMITVPSELSTTDFNTILRFDGSKQTTYKGWPLYYSTNTTVYPLDPSRFPPGGG